MRSIRSAAIHCFFASLVFYLASCCTEANCIDGVSIEVERNWEPGTTWFVVTVDEELHACTFDYPKEPPESRIPCIESVDDDSSERHSLFEDKARIFISGTPEVVKVEIFHMGKQVFSRTVEPEYRDERPNGEACDPTCRYASVTLSDAD